MNKKRRIIAPALTGLLFLGGFAGAAGATPAEEAVTSFGNLSAGNHKLSIRVDGWIRRYVIHVPQGDQRNKSLPVVIMFHGGGGTAKEAMWETGWAEKAESEGFLAVFPEGTAPDPNRPARFRDNPQTWNDGSRRLNIGAVQREVADVPFVCRMIAELRATFNVDERRIYATGFSNGAGMAFRLARERSTVLAAVAPVAGSDWMENRRPRRPVPLLYITGTADPLNPIEGGEIHIGRNSFGSKPVIREMIAKWAEINGCPTEPRVIYDKDGARGVAYGCASETAVVFYLLNGHGHHWPGGRSHLPERWAGKNATKLRATDVIWEFFKRNALPANDGAGVQR